MGYRFLVFRLAIFSRTMTSTADIEMGFARAQPILRAVPWKRDAAFQAGFDSAASRRQAWTPVRS
jgi:hypothetical protein